MSSENMQNPEAGDDVVIRVDHVSKVFEMYAKPRHRLQQMLFGRWKRWFKEFRALDDVSFEINRGEAIGVIGKNGAGKSTLLQILVQTLQPTEGEVWIKPGLRVAALLELGSGFNPEFTGRENVYMNASILGLTREQTDANIPRILDFADIGEFIDQPVKTYSSGMMVRLAFAVQVMVKPDILIVDEALAVGDAAFQRKCYARMEELIAGGTTIFLVTHSMENVINFCHRAIWLCNGHKEAEGKAKEITLAFMSSILGAKTDIKTDQAETNNSKMICCNGIELEPPISTAMISKRGDSNILGVAVYNDHGEKIHILQNKQKLNLYFLLSLDMDIPVAYISFQISNVVGVNIFSCNNHNLGNSRLHFRKGSKVLVHFVFDFPELQNDTYFLSVGINNGTPEYHQLCCFAWYSYAFKISSTNPEQKQTGLIKTDTCVLECTEVKG